MSILCIIFCIAKLWIQLINPIQQSIKVFEDKKHARQWLAYWAIYMILQLIEKIVIFIPMFFNLVLIIISIIGFLYIA